MKSQKSQRVSRTLAVGIAGGIGSGKTETCKIFESFGIQILYADLIARHLIDSDDEVKKKIQKLFGEHIYIDGHLDRKHVAMQIFADELLQKKMNAIVHPVVLQYIDKKIQQVKQDGREALIMVEAALLFESGADAMLDYVILIDANEEQRITRVMKRDNATRTAVVDRIKSQMPARETRHRADFIIHNNGHLSKLQEQSQFLFNLLIRIAKGKPST